MSTVGTWQLLMLVAGLREKAARDNQQGRKYRTEDVLVLYGAGLTEATKKWIIRVASSLWGWESILDCTDLMDAPTPWDNDGCRLRLESIRSRLGIDIFDEIWVCRLLYQQEKLLLETYKSASVHLYEDGLGNYLPSYEIRRSFFENLNQPLGFAKRVRRTILDSANLKSRIKSNGLRLVHLKRVVETYMFIAKDIKLATSLAEIECIHIQSDTLLKVINECKETLNISSSIDIVEGAEKNILVLGQCFSLFKMLTEEQEMQMYMDIVGSVIEKGYTVLWKDHPRCEMPFYPRLEETFGQRIQSVDLEAIVPIELVANRLNVKACVSCTSSILFYLPQLFQIDAYTFSHLVPHDIKDGQEYLRELISNRVKPYEMIAKVMS